MKILPLIISCLLLQSHNPLESLQWKNRIIIVHKVENMGLGGSQLKELKEYNRQLGERQVVVIEMVLNQVWVNDKLAALDYATLNQYLQIPEDNFQVLLIGKDGGIKYRSHRFTPAQDFLDRIDAMPMRQVELRNQ
ncbi:MAG: DUF4174 domain-containing protein [Cyclobacteriaceae bacterium]|nr:DUF4174 domain-containing protein [Cyclobacteriaceae bacterium]